MDSPPNPTPYAIGCVYLAAPKSEYESLQYPHLAATIRTLFPDAEIVEARTAFRDAAEWRAKWPTILPRITAFVFLTTPDGWIGRGVWSEIQEAIARVPVYLLSDSARLIPYDALTFWIPDAANWVRYARVSAGNGD